MDTNTTTVDRSPEDVAGLVALRRAKDRDGEHWLFTTTAALTDTEAAGLTMRSADLTVKLGETVIIEDDGGTRVGHTAIATMHGGGGLRPPYLTIGIELL